MKKINIVNIVTLSFWISALVSCSNDSIPDTAASLTTTAITVGKAESLNDLAVHYANVYVNYLASIKNYDPKDSTYTDPQQDTLTLKIDGATISIAKKDRNKYPHNISIDFAASGVTLRRGNILKGKIDIVEDGDMSIANSSQTFYFSNLFINGNAIKGIDKVTYMGLNADSKPYWKISVNDTIANAEGSTLTWNSERMRARINQGTDKNDDFESSLDSIRYDNKDSGDNVDNWPSLMYWVNIYSVSGTSNGVNEKGEAYSMSIDEANPLIIGGGFPFFTKGKGIITSDNDTEVIDYGDGTKDSEVTSTLYGVSIDFSLNK